MLSTLRKHRNLLMPFTVGSANIMGISSTENVATSYYNRFQKNYTDHLLQFRKKMEKLEEENQNVKKKPATKVYTHPYQNDHHPIVFSPVKTSELFLDAVGPEQVSVHYENFLVSRKFALVFIGGLLVIVLLANTTDITWIAKGLIIPWVYWGISMYLILEGRKSLFKPLLMRWYRRVAANDIYNFEVYYKENVSAKVRGLMKVAKNQIEYSIIHKDYNDIKAESINNFLISEYISLRKHIADRALNVMKSTQQYEEINTRSLFDSILQKTNKDLDDALKGKTLEEIKKYMFDAALLGLARGSMEYQQDPLLKHIEVAIQKHSKFILEKTPAEQAKMVSLTPDQLRLIQESDKRSRESYLHAEPDGLDGAIKNLDAVKKILADWGKQK